jgi:hypothetical protein
MRGEKSGDRQPRSRCVLIPREAADLQKALDPRYDGWEAKKREERSEKREERETGQPRSRCVLISRNAADRQKG